MQLGPHRLLCGDSSDAEHVAALVGEDLAALVMADPPYNVDYKGGTHRGGRIAPAREDAYPDTFEDYSGWLTKVLANGATGSDAKAALHIWFADPHLRSILTAIDNSGWNDRSLVVWDKLSVRGGLGQASKQYRTQFEPMLYCHKRGKTPRWYGPTTESTVWSEAGPKANPLHPTMKPLALYERSISNHTQVGDRVLELFGGSGTTLIACENLGRRAYLMEIDPGYCDVIIDRYHTHVDGQT